MRIVAMLCAALALLGCVDIDARAQGTVTIAGCPTADAGAPVDRD